MFFKIFSWMRKEKKPAWMSKSFDEANRAVNRITDQKLLWEIATNPAATDNVKERATRKIIASLESINDQKVFLDIAKDSEAPLPIRYEVVRRMLTDQKFLEEIANTPSPVDCHAIEKLTDQNLIVHFAKHSSDAKRIAAIKALTSPSIIEDIARNDPEGRVREEAMWKLPVPTSEEIKKDLCGKGIHYFTIPWMRGDSTLTTERHQFFCKYCHASNGKPNR